MEKPKPQTVVMGLSSPVENNHINGRMTVKVPGYGWDHKYFCDVRLNKILAWLHGNGIGCRKEKVTLRYLGI